MIALKDINLSFKNDLIIKSNLFIEDNQITVLYGPSGSGKSSLLYDIALITNYSKFNYFFDNVNITHFSEDELRHIQQTKMSVVFQNIPLFENLTLIENLKFFSSMTHKYFDEEKARTYLTDFEIFNDDNTDISSLSGGERQRLAIVCALMKDTPYLLMDEPTSYLDEDNRRELLNILLLLKNKYNKTVFIATHDESIKKIADVVYEIRDKSIIKLQENTNLSGTTNRDINVNNHYPFSDFSFPLKANLRKNKWMTFMFQFLLTIVLFSFTFIVVYLGHYQKQLNNEILLMKSTQMVVDLQHNVDGKVLRNIDGLENIQDVQKISAIESENNYLICPYISLDYFEKYIGSQVQTDTNIIINYETYRQNKFQNITLDFGKIQFNIEAQYQLNNNFQDYRLGRGTAKVIYIPFEKYTEMLQVLGLSNLPTTFVILELQDKNEYINTLQFLSQKYSQITLSGHEDVMNLLNINNIMNGLSSIFFISILSVIILAIIVLKIIECYQGRYTAILLEVNGVNKNKIFRKNQIFEIYKFILPMCISLIILLGAYYIMGLLDKEICILSLIIVFLLSGLVHIIFIAIYFLINHIFSSDKILKSL